jgi:hypothetical protein
VRRQSARTPTRALHRGGPETRLWLGGLYIEVRQVRTSFSTPQLWQLLAEEITGRGERIRTSDLCVPNAALYQAEPRPDHDPLDIAAANRAPNTSHPLGFGQGQSQPLCGSAHNKGITLRILSKCMSATEPVTSLRSFCGQRPVPATNRSTRPHHSNRRRPAVTRACTTPLRRPTCHALSPAHPGDSRIAG